MPIKIADEDLEILLRDADELNYRNLDQYLGYLAKARARELRERQRAVVAEPAEVA
jgi:hypothetical protein